MSIYPYPHDMYVCIESKVSLSIITLSLKISTYYSYKLLTCMHTFINIHIFIHTRIHSYTNCLQNLFTNFTSIYKELTLYMLLYVNFLETGEALQCA